MYYTVLLFGYIFQLFNKRVFFWLFGIILFLLAAFRYGVGVDYFSYGYLYNRLHTPFWVEIKYGLENQEIGFRAIGSALKSLGFSYQQYIALIAAINIFFTMKICKRYSKNPTLALFIFFCFYYLTWVFNGIRQGVIIAAGLYYLLRYIEDKKTLKFLVIVGMLSLIHTSALVLIVLYLLTKFNLSKNKLTIISIISILISLLPTGYLISKLTFLPLYGRIAPYINAEFSLNIPDFQGFGRILFLLIALVFYDVYCKQSEMSKKIMNMYILSMILYFLFQFSELTAARLAIYGKFLDVIILANVLYMYKQRINRLLYVYAIFILCFVYLFKESESLERAIVNDSIVTPYVNIMNKDDYSFHSRYQLYLDD